MQSLIALWHCVTGPSGGNQAPEINASAGLAAVALLVSVAAVAYRQAQKQ